MKKNLLILLALLPILGYSQAITVDTSTRTVPQLVTDVLINSPCTEVTNISWRTGTNFGSSNGIGYFQNTNPNFPISSGVVLTTGDANNAPGPNTSILNDGNTPAWVGDTDLENVLAAAGITMNSVNATVLEFDFVPISSNFSVDFLFASEEYGNSQCSFSDAFAFLLTNQNTGVTENLAVIPNTTTPISVLTIRDFLYNSSCASANAEYFGKFNGGSEAPGAAINFNGQTVLFQAASVLIPNTPYHIKLVIADRSDYKSDSAIFLSSDSFNIGQDVLGPDLTIASNTAICQGGTHILTTGLSTDTYSFAWTQDGAPVGGNVAELSISDPGTYTVTYNNILFPCEAPVTDSIIVEYYRQLITPDPVPLYKCNTGQPTYNFDLSYNTPIILSGIDPGVTISYHANRIDAGSGENILPAIRQSAGNESIYVRITDTNGCVTIKSFDLLLIAPPTATEPDDITECAISLNSTDGNFTFASQDTAVLGALPSSVYNVLYYTSLENAQAGTNPLPSVDYITGGNQTIYVRIENKTDTDCYDTTSFEIFVKNLPVVDILQNIIVCDQHELIALTNGNYFSGPDGTGTPLLPGDIITETQTIYIYNQSGGIPNCSNQSSFRITIIDPESLTPPDGRYCTSYVLPGLEFGNYFTQPGGNGTQIPFGTEITSTQTIYVYYRFPEEPFCIVDSSFEVEIIPFQNLPEIASVFDCDSYVLPTLAFGNYYTQPGGTGTIIPGGTTITTTQAIYAYVQNDICVDEKPFTVFIGIDTPPNAENCSSYTLPPLPIGNYYTGPAGSGTQIPAGTVITTTQTIYVYVATTEVPNCTDNIHFEVTITDPFPAIPNDVTICGSYVLPAITVGNYYTAPGGTGTMLLAGQTITSTQRIYIYKPITPGQNCTNEISYMVTINPIPQISSRSDIGPTCTPYTLTPLAVGNYYTAPGGNGTMLSAGDVISETQTIYIYATTTTEPPCSAENSFTITIVGIEADSPDPVISCDSYLLPALAVGDYFTEANGQGTMLNAGDVISTTTTLHIYAEIDNRGEICSDGNLFEITIATTPVVNPIPEDLKITCDNDAINDGFTSVDLTAFSDFALGSQLLEDYIVEYFESENNALTRTNPVTASAIKNIYVRISSRISDRCYAIMPIRITVHRVPEPRPRGGTVCINSETNQLVSSHTIQTGLSTSLHTFQWFDANGLISGATGSFYTATVPGSYSVIATSNATGCSSNLVTVEVIRSEKPTVTYTVNNNFGDNQSITVIATGVGGNYVYQLDGGPFQESNVFEDVASGEHTITVNDLNGCESTTIVALVINYPKYFTPNGDGYNDYWNIWDLSHQPEAVIYIFDRYGKLLKQIKPSQPGGWDGFYNNAPMPSTDYWFKVIYLENGTTKEFRAHFAMKR
ncbi:T9SS type B sorting domain-containing protein [Flavobacterium sp. WW92]|uniref:T9SS type B sorting domain-containing protein n=1 Tax=unclassified Flavobacterium TaxID=196869 RepID=UPI002224FF86|nr:MULTISPECIES: T9SS type B sorting domain-containing protein [unclassified Flavobacterium]WDO13024.1 T9SS type B sorting domain-containing protein [Flavobacterium sp. WW92]